MLNDFVLQYDKAIAGRRHAEEDEDFHTINSKDALTIKHPIVMQAGERLVSFSRTNSHECSHDMLSKDGDSAIYLVGQYNEEKYRWKKVAYVARYDNVWVNCACVSANWSIVQTCIIHDA